MKKGFVIFYCVCVVLAFAAFIAFFSLFFDNSGSVGGGSSRTKTSNSVSGSYSSSNSSLQDDSFDVVFSNTVYKISSDSSTIYFLTAFDYVNPQNCQTSILLGYYIESTDTYVYSSVYYIGFGDLSVSAIFGDYYADYFLNVLEVPYSDYICVRPFIASYITDSDFDINDSSTFTVVGYYWGSSYSYGSPPHSGTHTILI